MCDRHEDVEVKFQELEPAPHKPTSPAPITLPVLDSSRGHVGNA